MKQDAIQPRLSIKQISKSYVAVHALRKIDFVMAASEIHALVGENGAGKTTLAKIITGIESANAGKLVLDGAESRFHNPMEARANGVPAVYQDPKLLPNLDIAENVFMGIHSKTKVGFVDRKAMYRQNDLTHGATLSALLPGVMALHISTQTWKLSQFARRVLNIQGSWKDTEADVARNRIATFMSWCTKIGAPMTLKEIGAKRGFCKDIQQSLLQPLGKESVGGRRDGDSFDEL